MSKNTHWLVCTKCLVAWPPNDIKPGHKHYEGPDEGPWTECKGEIIALELAAPGDGDMHIGCTTEAEGDRLRARIEQLEAALNDETA